MVGFLLFLQFFLPRLHLVFHTQSIDGKIGGTLCYKIDVFYLWLKKIMFVYLYI